MIHPDEIVFIQYGKLIALMKRIEKLEKELAKATSK